MIDDHGDIQVAIYDDGSCSHFVHFNFRIGRRTEEVIDPTDIDEDLDDIFISIY